MSPKSSSIWALLPLLFCEFSTLTAQTHAVGFRLGIANYQGDLTVNQLDFHPTNLAAGLFYRRELSPKVAMRVALDFGKVDGADADYPERAARGFAFSTNLFGASINAQLSPFAKERYDKNGEFTKQFLPVLFTGLGAVVFNPKTTGLPLDAPELAKNGSQFKLFVPFGLGFHYDLNTDITVGLEAITHVPFTNYLDGVSESGNPGNHDWFSFAAVSVQYWLNAPERKKAQPTDAPFSK